ncbi:MAG: cytochrome P450 [Pirellulaceae bacterium]|nr:cytochrome P450 [Planctomycetales bacterium]
MTAHRKYPPGPNDYAFGTRSMARMRRDILGYFAELKQNYGDAVSFVTGGYRLYIFFHPDQIHEVLVTRAKSTTRLPRVMQTIAQWNGDSLLIVEGEKWIRQRRMVQQAFQPRRIQSYGDAMAACIRELASRWDGDLNGKAFVDIEIDKQMTQLTLAIICQTMFSKRVDEFSSDIARAVAVLSDIAFHEMQAFVRLPNWLPTARNRDKRWAIALLDRIVWDLIRQRRSTPTDHGDLLSMLLSTVDDQANNQGMSDRQVRDEAMTLMLAGHDTSAAALDWYWYNLASHPDVVRHCQEEIDRVTGGDPPTFDHIAQLQYIQATIKESLRLFPPAVGVFLRQNTADLEIGGYHVHKGSLISLSSYVVQRDPRWFPNPESFQPDRFLDGRADQLPDGAYFPFGAGPRVCIGQSFAMTEFLLAAAILLQKFDVSLPPDTPRPIPHVTLAMRPRDPLVLRWTRRAVAESKASTTATLHNP